MSRSMPKGLNKVMIIGCLDGEPELRFAPGGQAVASFSVAIPYAWSSPNGGDQEETDWFNVVAWGSLAETCAQQLCNGQQVYIEGRLQTRSWEDHAGRRHFRTEVVAQTMIALSDNV